MPMTDDLAVRVEKLEQEVRRWRAAALLVVAAIAAGVACRKPAEQKMTPQHEIVFESPDHAHVTRVSPAGVEVFGGDVTVSAQGGSLRVHADDNSIALNLMSGQSGASLRVGKDGQPAIALERDAQSTASMFVDKGRSVVELHDSASRYAVLSTEQSSGQK